jgi:ribosomal protein S27AE
MSLDKSNFGLGVLQETLYIDEILQKEGKGPEDLKDYLTAGSIAHTRTVLIAAEELRAKFPKCLKCGETMFFYPVNHMPSVMIGGDANIVWECPNDPCEFSMESTDPEEMWKFEAPKDTHPLAEAVSKFNNGMLRKVSAVFDFLKAADMTTKDLSDYIENKHAENKAIDEAKHKMGRVLKLITPKCPKCGNALLGFGLDENEKGWKSRWLCSKDWYSKDMNKWCNYEKLSAKTIREILDEGVQYQIRRGPEEGIKVERHQSSQ